MPKQAKWICADCCHRKWHMEDWRCVLQVVAERCNSDWPACKLFKAKEP